MRKGTVLGYVDRNGKIILFGDHVKLRDNIYEICKSEETNEVLVGKYHISEVYSECEIIPEEVIMNVKHK